ncbi:MAG TPA: M48 family metalloprotease [Candidatus Binatia bacterium]|nr:M48 family metalloprotease [Candidatus Binatia bacterium]
MTLARGFCFNINVHEPENILEPLRYHLELRDYLKSEERELWNWFSSAQAKADYTENLRLELLKSTYRLDAEGHPELHQSLNEAKARLGLDVPVTLYQAQNTSQLNAALYYIPGQGHVVFSGPAFTLLKGEELKSVLGHELAHYLLWERDAGEFHIAERLIHAVANDPRASASHEQTARRYQLYTEIFADRGSLRVTGDAGSVVAGLVKMQTGLTQVSAASYLKQAEEIFANGNVSAEGVSHPEAFIRARALALWQEQGENAAAQISGMIEGGARLDELDLMGQKRLTSATKRLLQYLLKPKWFQTPATLGHAKLFFDNFRPADGHDTLPGDELKFKDAKLHEYLCYVLLDFAKADPELEEMPLAAAFEVSRQLELDEKFEKLAAKELKMRVRDVRRVKEQAAEMLAKAEANGE